MQIEIRQTKVEDNEAIAAIGIKCWQDAYKDIFSKQLLDNLSLEERLKQRLNWFNSLNKHSVVAIAKTTSKVVDEVSNGKVQGVFQGEQSSLHKVGEHAQNLDSNAAIFHLKQVYEDKIIGFCDYGESRRPQFAPGEIYSLYVLPEYKGLGIVKLLILKAIEHLNAVNLSPFIVTTLEVNTPARKFYEKLGFKEISHIMTEVGDKIYKETVYLYEK